MQFRQLLRRLYYSLKPKHSAELGYWQKCWRKEGGCFSNAHYEKLLLAMAREQDQSFLKGKVVADFGCGPRGSLSWIKAATALIGIDVLIPHYLQHFESCMKQHNMTYLSSTESYIPLPDNSVDILFSLNALDHVQELPIICQELRRVLKPGGEIIGSFNLYQAPTAAEPQCLTPEILDKYLLKGFSIQRRLISAIPKQGYLYQPLLDEKPLPVHNEAAVMWVRARKG